MHYWDDIITAQSFEKFRTYAFDELWLHFRSVIPA